MSWYREGPRERAFEDFCYGAGIGSLLTLCVVGLLVILLVEDDTPPCNGLQIEDMCLTPAQSLELLRLGIQNHQNR